jgi:hypothetical protein
MADDTREFEVFVGDRKYKVDAANMNQAVRDAQAYHQEQLNQRRQTEYDEAPLWSKGLKTAGDVALNTSSMFGAPYLIDKALGTENVQQEAAASRARLGRAAIPLDIATAVAAPSPAAWATKAMAGGPLARGIFGTTLSGLEGAMYGGLQGLSSEQGGEGAAIGAASGMLGHQLGPAVNKMVNMAKGASPVVPSGGRAGIMQIPPGIMNPSPADKVNVLHNLAVSKASSSDNPLAYQEDIKKSIGNLYRTDRKSFTPEQKEMMTRVVGEDPATKASRVAGNYLSNKWLAGGAGGAVWASGNPLAGLLTSGTFLGAGRILKEASAGGTEEAMRELRRSVMKRPPYRGLLSSDSSSRIGRGARQYGLDDYLYE